MRSSTLALAALALALPAAAAELQLDARWPALATGPLQDDSFLIEEAYNQERGVVQHISTGVRDQRTGDWTTAYTQEWPLFDVQHQLSFTVPLAWETESGGDRGVGSVFLNYRYQLLTETPDRPAVAPRLSLLLPTGTFDDGHGSDSTGVQVGLPVSKQLDEHFAVHLNAGATVVPDAHAADDRPGRHTLWSWTTGGSVIWEPVDAVNFLGELLAVGDDRVTPGGGESRRTLLFFDPGVRVGWNGPGGVQYVWGIAFPIGLTRATDDLSVLFYLSVEHAVTAEARKERSW